MIVRTLGIATLVLALASGGTAAAGAPHLSVRLDEPFVAGARSFDGGLLSLRALRSYSPSTALGELWVGGECLGLVVARRAPSGARASSADRVLFHRGPQGRLVLAGYVFHGLGDGATYWLEPMARDTTHPADSDAEPAGFAAARLE